MHLRLISLTGLLIATCCSCAVTPRSDSVPQRLLAQGRSCLPAPDSAHLVSMDNLAEYQRAWLQANRNTLADASSTPEVDFTREQVVAIYMGTRPSAGYRISVSQDRPGTVSAGTLTLPVIWSEPGANTYTAQVVTSPCLFLAIAKGPYANIEVRDQQGAIRITSHRQPEAR